MRSLRVDVFCEDVAQENFARAMVERVAAEEAVAPLLAVRSARGGAARALEGLRAYQRGLTNGSLGLPVPDLLVVLIDANAAGWKKRHREISEAVDSSLIPRHALGCPDPQVESWYMADTQGFRDVVGVPPLSPRASRLRDEKERLRQSVESGKVVSIAGGIDLAPELVDAMDLFRAGKQEPSLKHFLDELRNGLRG